VSGDIVRKALVRASQTSAYPRLRLCTTRARRILFDRIAARRHLRRATVTERRRARP